MTFYFEILKPSLFKGFCKRGRRPDLSPDSRHAHPQGRAVPPGQAGGPGLGLPVQQGPLQVKAEPE